MHNGLFDNRYCKLASFPSKTEHEPTVMLLIAQEKHQCTQLIAEPESQPLKCSELFVFGKN